MTGALSPCPFIRAATGEEVPLNTRVIGHFMVCKVRHETNLLQLFAHPENSQWFSMIFVIVFEANVVAEQKQA